MIEQILLIIGAAILGLLGLIHLLYTFFTDKFNAYDPQVTKAMQGTSPILTKETTLWRAWIGFNASHCLGLLFVAGVYLPLAINHMALIRQSVWFAVLPTIIGIGYLILAKKYWFKIPFVGAFVASLCFIAALLFIQL